MTTRQYVEATSQCALCDRSMWTRYGFRMHMARMHAYRSRVHRSPGTGQGKGHPRRRFFR